MPINYIEFAEKIKQKYPDYAEVDNLVLAKKMVEKYPEYSEQVTFDDVLKTKEESFVPEMKDKADSLAFLLDKPKEFAEYRLAHMPATSDLYLKEGFEGQEPSYGKRALALGSDFLSSPMRKLEELAGGNPMGATKDDRGFLSQISSDPLLMVGGGTGALATKLVPQAGKLAGAVRGGLQSLADIGVESGFRYGRDEDPLSVGEVVGSSTIGTALGGTLAKGVKPSIVEDVTKAKNPQKAIELSKKQAIEAQKPIGMSDKDFEKLPELLKPRIKDALENEPQFMSELINKTIDYKNNAIKESPFEWLADTKLNPAIDAFESDINQVGAKIGEAQKYISEIPSEGLSEYLEKINIGGKRDGKITPIETDKGIDFVVMLPNGKKTAPNEAQKITIDILREKGADVDGIDAQDLKDKLLNASKKKDAEASVKKMYKAVKDDIDSKIVNVAREIGDTDVAENYTSYLSDYASKSSDMDKLLKSFGEKRSAFDSDIGEWIGDGYSKGSQRLKTLSKNPENWQEATEILEDRTGFDVRKYADLVRGVGVAGDIERYSSLLETPKPRGTIPDKRGLIDVGFDVAKGVKEKVIPTQSPMAILAGGLRQKQTPQWMQGLQDYLPQATQNLSRLNVPFVTATDDYLFEDNK